MSLFIVLLERELVVDAEDSLEAERIAIQNEREETSNCDPSVYASPITDRKQVPHEWLDSCPYGRDDSKTVGQLLDEIPEPPFVDTRTLDIFGQA